MSNLIYSTKQFENQAKKVLSEAELADVKARIGADPINAGTAIPRSGGVRYTRVAAKGHGKGRGARVVYWFDGGAGKVWLIACYFKGRKQTITFADAKEFRRLVENLRGR